METLSKPPQMLESGPEQELLPENIEGSERHIDVVDESETTTVEVTQGHGDDHENIPTPANLEFDISPSEAREGQKVLRSVGAIALERGAFDVTQEEIDEAVQQLEDIANSNSPTEVVELDEFDLSK